MSHAILKACRRPSPGVSLLVLALSAALAGCAITPAPVTQAEQAAQASADRQLLFSDQEAVTGPISLNEAIARAIKYNLDHRLAVMEQALQNRQIDLSRYDILPKLAANAGYSTRSNENASSSRSYLTGRQSLEPSVSQDRQRETADLTTTWNILDFGVGYYAAHQQADRSLIAAERRRKVLHSIIQQVRGAYWQAATAQRLQASINPVLAEARQALADSRQAEREQLLPPLDALRYRKALMEAVRQLEAQEADLVVAKAQLAALMSLPPGQAFEVAIPDDALRTLPEIPLALDDMERLALANRPELREEIYQARVSAGETRKAMLRMLPGVSVLAGLNYDSNSYLVHEQWAEAGTRVTWNLLSLFSGPAAIRAAEAQEEVARTRRMALSMAVLAQVHVATGNYQRARTQYQKAAELEEVETRINEIVKSQAASDAQSTIERIRAATSAIAAELERDRSLAEAQNAASSIYVTLGLDPLPEAVEGHDIASLAAALKRIGDDWRQGRMPMPAAETVSAPGGKEGDV